MESDLPQAKRVPIAARPMSVAKSQRSIGMCAAGDGPSLPRTGCPVPHAPNSSETAKVYRHEWCAKPGAPPPPLCAQRL